MGALIGLEALAGGLNQLVAGNERRRREGREDERFELEKQQALLQMQRIGLAIEESEFQLALDKARGTPDEIATQADEDRKHLLAKRAQDLNLDMVSSAFEGRRVAALERQAEAQLINANRPSRGEGQLQTEVLKQLKGQADGSEKELDLLDEQIERLVNDNINGGFDEEITRLRIQRQEVFERLQGDQTALRQAQFAASGRVPEPEPFEPQGPPVPEGLDDNGESLLGFLSPSGAVEGAVNLAGMAGEALSNFFAGGLRNRTSVPGFDLGQRGQPQAVGPGPMVDISPFAFQGPPVPQAPPAPPLPGGLQTIPSAPLRIGPPLTPEEEALNALLGGQGR